MVNPDKSATYYCVPPQVAVTDIGVFNRSLKSGKGSDGIAFARLGHRAHGIDIARQESVL